MPPSGDVSILADDDNGVTVEGARAGFPNDGNTCYLGAILSSLLSLPAISHLLHHTACTASCTQPCVLQALSLCEVASRARALGTPSVVCWKDILASWKLEWTRQHDVIEVLQRIFLKLPLDILTLFQTLRVTRQDRAYTCQCAQLPQTAHTIDTYHVDVQAPSMPMTLDQLLQRTDQWADPVDSHCATCHARLALRQRVGYVPTSQFLLITLRRYGGATDASSTFLRLRIPKRRTLVEPPEVLEQASAHWPLISVIVHHGDTRTSGHYTTYNRQDNSWIHVDDDVKQIFDSLPHVVSTDGVVFTYARIGDPDIHQPDLATSPQHATSPAPPPLADAHEDADRSHAAETGGASRQASVESSKDATDFDCDALPPLPAHPYIPPRVYVSEGRVMLSTQDTPDMQGQPIGIPSEPDHHGHDVNDDVASSDFDNVDLLNG